MSRAVKRSWLKGTRNSATQPALSMQIQELEASLGIALVERTRSGVKLTPKGERIASMSRFFRLHLLPKKRLLMGEYTDDLTNPFRNSIETPDYLCQ